MTNYKFDTIDDIANALFKEGFVEMDSYDNYLFVSPDGGGDITDGDIDLVYEVANMYDSVEVWSDTPNTITIQIGV